MPRVIRLQNRRVRPRVRAMFGSRAAVTESSRMHWVTSLKTVRAKPGGIRTEAQAWANTRHAAARIHSFDVSDKTHPLVAFLTAEPCFGGFLNNLQAPPPARDGAARGREDCRNLTF